MAIQGWVDALSVQESAGTSFGSFTTAKTVIPATALKIIRANELRIGSAFKIEVRGAISNIVTTPGTIVFQTMVGSVIAFTTGVIQLNATAHTLLPFRLDIDLTCRAIGSGTSALFMGQGEIAGKMFTRTAGTTDDGNNDTILMCPATTPAVGTGFDSTIDNILDLFAGFSINDAGNVVKIEQYRVLRYN